MLDHAFSFADTAIFWVGEHNWRSQGAMTKIGGVRREGLLTRELSGETKYFISRSPKGRYEGGGRALLGVTPDCGLVGPRSSGGTACGGSRHDASSGRQIIRIAMDDRSAPRAQLVLMTLVLSLPLLVRSFLFSPSMFRRAR